MPFYAGYSASMKYEERSTVKRNVAVKDRADGVGAMSGRAWRLRAKCFFVFFRPKIFDRVQFFHVLALYTISKNTRKSKTTHGSDCRRDCIWEVRSKASTPEMTKKPFKAFLHRKADKVLRFFQTARAGKEASSIFDLDKQARFNYLISKCSENFLLSEVANIKQFILNFSYLRVICG